MKQLLPILLLSLFLSLVVTASARPAVQSVEEALEAESLWHWQWASDVRLSPDGERLVYVRTEVDREQDRYRTDLWIKELGEARHRPLTTHEASDQRPRWSPDGRRVAFVSGRDEESQIWVIDLGGGEARQLTRLKGGAGTPVWSPDGTRIAFASRALTSEAREKQREAEREQRRAARKARGLDEDTAMESADGPTVITTLRYRSDGRSAYLPEDKEHLWVVDAGDDAEWPVKPRRVTRDDHDHGTPAWSGDGGYLFFSALLEPDADWRSQESHVYRVAVDGATAPEQLTEGRRSRGRPMASPDGKWIAFTGAEHREAALSYTLGQLYVMPADGGEERMLTLAYDRGVGDGTSGDMTAPGGNGTRVAWAPDSESLWFTSAADGETHLARVARERGEVEQVTAFDAGHLAEFSAGTEQVALVWGSPRQPFDIYLSDLQTLGERDRWRQLTELNAARLEERQFPGYEVVRYPSFDERDIQGWVIRPPNFDAGKAYPALLYIHGGPHAMYGTTFFHEFQYLADAGYVVLITNPRGSSGYGQEFGNVIQYAYPGDDYLDLMAGVDWLLEQGYVDPSRLGVAGGSGGGLLTTWAITQTDRFAAAIAQRSVTNWHSFVGTSDMNLLFVDRWFPVPPWQDPMHYIARSPLAHVDRVNTPIMLIHSERDWRTPLEQTQQFYTQLRMQQKEAKMVIFPDASHGLSRIGRPSQRIERMRLIREWFDEYLMK